jgi:hypothetical protein
MRRAVRGGEGSWSVCVDALAYVGFICGGRGSEEWQPHVHGAVFEAVFGCDRGRTGSGAGVVRKSFTALWSAAEMGDGAKMTD